jgi:hypothetical protein
MSNKPSILTKVFSKKGKASKFMRKFLFQCLLGVCVALAVGWILEFPRSFFVNPVRYRIPTDAGFGFVNAVVAKLNTELQEDCGYPKWLRTLLGKHCVSLVFSPQILENMVVCQEFDTRRKNPEEALNVFVIQYGDCIIVDKSNPKIWKIKEKHGGSIVKRSRTTDTSYFFCNCDSSSIDDALPVVKKSFGSPIRKDK